jgi:hypothetical protein
MKRKLRKKKIQMITQIIIIQHNKITNKKMNQNYH